MALRGNLKDFSLPDVFQLVQLSGKTGVLRIAGVESEGSIWFRDGEVFFAQSNWRREQLGERLVSAQRITPAALARALELRAVEPEGGRRLGEILVNEGYITQQVLESFVQEQIQDTIFDLMRWDEGDFDFEVLPEVVNEDIGLSVSVENIVMEGSRRLEEWQRIKKKVPSTDMVFKMATAPGEGTFEISLKPVEWALLLLIDGTRSVRELAVETRSTDFDVARVVYGLFSAGLLEVPSDEEIERLRADRARREDKRAALDAERAAVDAAQQATALDIEAQLAASAQARKAAAEAGPTEPEPAAEEVPEEVAEEAEAPAVPEESPAETEQVASEPEHVPEEPEFLAAPAAAPSTEDVAVFEQMMASMLTPSAAPAVEPEASGELASETGFEAMPGLAFEPEPQALGEAVLGTEALPEVAPEEEFPVPVVPGMEFVPGLDFMPEAEAVVAVPIGETPLEIEEPPAIEEFEFGAISSGDLESIPAPPVSAETPAEAPATTGDFEADLRSLGLGELPEELLAPGLPSETRLPMSEMGAAEAAAPAVDADLDTLLASLGGTEGEPSGVISSGTDFGAQEEASGEYISTDAFLAEFDSGVGLASGLGDELTALTGGGAAARNRPMATVSKIPEAGEGHVLHRDQMVDRSLVEKIIEGIENL